MDYRKLSLTLLLALLLSYAGYLASCEHPSTAPIEPVRPTKLIEVPMAMTLDSLTTLAHQLGYSNLRTTNDGIFNFVFLSDGFNQQNKWIFDQHCNHLQSFISALHPFDSLYALGKLQFQRKAVNGNFNCTSGGFEVLVCNWNKVIKAGFSDGMQPDFLHIFSLGNGFGTGNGGISVIGIGTGQPSSFDYCYYWDKLPKIDCHEIGHGLGLGHSFIPTYVDNLMAQATNGGCELGSIFLPFQHDIILNYINTHIN